MDPPLPPTTGGTPTRALTFDPASTTSPIVLQKAAAAAERRRRQQPSSAACKVFVRVRPAKQDAALDSTIEVSGTTLRARAPVDSMASRHHRDAATECAKEYSFTGVFDPTSTQEDVYDVAFKDSVDALFVPSGAGGHLRGHRSALLFCFGPSNSGKTYTVVGDGGVGAPARGVLIRAIENVLAQLNDEERCVEWSPLTTRVEVHFVEVHNEAVYDLLATPATGKAARRGFGTGRKKTVRPQLKVYGRGQIQDVVTVEVNDVASAMETMQRGLERRAVCNNEINSSSSRSHSIFTLRLVHRDAAVAARTSIQLTVVDLAGSERSKRTSGVSGSVREEAANINQSLTTLMKVIRARRETRGGYASFRESMLTRILEPLLCGAKNLSSSVMIANVSPDELDYDEAIATLNHAAITSKNVVVEARPVKKPVVHAKYDSNGHLIVEGGAEKKKRSSRGSGRQRRGSNGKRSSGSSTGRTSIEGEGEEAELVVPLQHRAKRSGSAYVKRTKLATFKQQARGGDRAQIAEIARIHAECEAKIEVQKEEALEFTARRLAALDLEHDRALEAELEAAMRRAAALTELQMRNERDTRMKSNRKLSQKDRMIRDLEDENDALKQRVQELEEAETDDRCKLTRKALKTLDKILDDRCISAELSMAKRLEKLHKICTRYLELEEEEEEEVSSCDDSESESVSRRGTLEPEWTRADLVKELEEAQEEGGENAALASNARVVASPVKRVYQTRSKKKKVMKKMKNTIRAALRMRRSTRVK